MKNILFISQINYVNDFLFCENFIDFLSGKDCKVSVLSNKKLNVNKRAVFLNTLQFEDEYEIVIAYNKAALRKAKKFSDNIPIFYCCSAENSLQELVNIYDYDKLLIVGKPKPPVYDNTCLFINTFYNKLKEDGIKDDIIVVAVNNINVLEQLTPFINIFLTETFHVLSVLEKYKITNFNPNVKIIGNQDKVLDSLSSSKTIIGEGQSAIRGILMEKPVLVLGKYGYGGLVTKDNIELLYKYGFHGRVGGEENEYLPFELIEYDLNKSQTIAKDELKKLKCYLKNLIQKEYQALINDIEFYINLKEQNKERIKFIKNELYTLISISDSFYLKNRISNQLVYELNESEASFFNFFNEPASLMDFFRKNPRMHVTNDLIDDLIYLKAIVYKTYG